MRDWIGTGISLLGLALVVITLVQVIRARGRRSPQGGRAMRGSQYLLLKLCAGLATVEAGQLIRAQSWPWAILHLVVIGVVATGALLIWRDLRNVPRRSR